MSQEIWKEHPDFEGVVRVSSYGRVARRNEQPTVQIIIDQKIIDVPSNAMTFSVVSQTRLPDGSKKVGLRYNNEGGTYYVHHLVAETFLTIDDQDKRDILHIDKNKGNNHVENLMYHNKAETTLAKREALRHKISEKKRKQRLDREVEEFQNQISALMDLPDEP